MNDFSTRQNANNMLILQFAARQHYNRAERFNLFYWILCILDIVLVRVYENILQEPLIAGLISGGIIFLLMFVINEQVERNTSIAAGMRQLFDYKLFGFNLPNSFQGYTRKSLVTFASVEKQRNIKKFIQQINNDGHSKKSGVKNWYDSITDDMTIDEAIRTCQNENRFFDNILTKITLAGFILILMMAFFVFFLLSTNNYLFIALSLTPLYQNLFLSFYNLIKLIQFKISREACFSLQSATIEERQEYIDERRNLPFIVPNILYILNLKKISSIFNDVNSNAD